LSRNLSRFIEKVSRNPDLIINAVMGSGGPFEDDVRAESTLFCAGTRFKNKLEWLSF
jgi:hypothetical protein